MLSPRRFGAVFGAFSLFVLSSCTDSGVVTPDAIDGPTPSYALFDGTTGGSSDFYLLPPLAGSPSIVGDFNPNLRPAMRVCAIGELELGLQNETKTCEGRPLVAYFPPGSAVVGSDKYQISWDTDGPETGPIDTDSYLLLEIVVADEVMGWIELDPQDPDGPGRSGFEGLSFRLGETIPVKFWLSQEVLCAGDSYVTECITGAVINQEGGNLSLQDEGNKLGVIIYQNSLPTSTGGEITVTVERIDPVEFYNATGEECIPGLGAVGTFDAPQFGDCFRVRTIPELSEPLLNDALVSICLDPGSIAGFGLSEEQEKELTMVRFDDYTEDEWEALTDAFGDCPSQQASLLDVPDQGFFRYAAMGINAVASFLGPQPVEARDLRLGGLTTSFSRFRYTLPGQMVPAEGDGTIIQATDDNTIAATINVIDHEGLPVADALVHFSTADGTLDGAIATTADAVSDADGYATVRWTVDRSTAGDKTLMASAFGLLEEDVPEHSQNFLFTAADVSLTATVVGPPSSLGQDPNSNIDDAVAGEPETLTVIVTDENGNFVEGATVTWTCTPECKIPETSTTGADGSTTIEWTPLTSGSQASVASIGVAGVPDATFTATVAPGAAVGPTWPTVPESSTAGLALGDALVITVTDEYGNPRVGDVVSWTLGSSSGSVSSTSTNVGADGTAQVTWTLDQLVGDNTLTVAVGEFSTVLTVAGESGPPVQPTGAPASQDGVVNEALGSALAVTVTDQFGNPIAGQAVGWFTTDGGSFSPASASTDAAGMAATSWTLGTTAGAQNATASIASFTVDFAANAAPGVAATLNPSQSTTSAYVGSNLDLGIRLEDAFGNPRSGEVVSWSITAGGGSFGGSASQGGTSAADGTTATTWTLGAMPGTNSASVSAGGLTATFDVAGECFDGWGAPTGIDGALDGGWACAQMETFMANVSGGNVLTEVYWMNDTNNLYLAVRVPQPSLDKSNDVRFDFDNDGDGVTEVGDDAIGYASGSFLDQYLDGKCLNRNQSGCGTTDSSVDGSGAVANDGTWTTFELSHPLAGTPGQDLVRAANDPIGFFLSLQQGKGAQGNTQFPGFRQYLQIVIQGLGG